MVFYYLIWRTFYVNKMLEIRRDCRLRLCSTFVWRRTPWRVPLNLWHVARFGDFALKHLANDDSVFGVAQTRCYIY